VISTLKVYRTSVSSVSRSAIPAQLTLGFSLFASHKVTVVRPRFVDYIKAKGCVFARESYRKRIHATVLI